MINKSLVEYYEALERVATNNAKIVEKGSKINNDTISLEAGRGKGSIKKSRPRFAKLIAEIEKAAALQIEPIANEKSNLLSLKEKITELNLKLEEAYAREASLLHELFALKRQLGQMTGNNIAPLRTSKLI